MASKQLKQFKEQNGHFKVPRNHPRLGSWSVYHRAQCKLFKEGNPVRISQAKIDKLISIGFLEKHDEFSIKQASVPTIPLIQPPG